jgi:hypothetical protein
MASGCEYPVDIEGETVDGGGKMGAEKLKTPEKVSKQKFDQVLARMIATPPIRSKELVGSPKKPKSQK